MTPMEMTKTSVLGKKILTVMIRMSCKDLK